VRVLYFGTYQRDYPRNAQVISCLRRAGVEVVERHVKVWHGRQNWAASFVTGAKVALSELRLLRPARSFDVLIVGYPGHFDMPAARIAALGRPVVFNPLVSLVDTLVEDRGRFRRRSAAARVLASVDRQAFRRADLVVADTAAHADFFAEALAVQREHVEVCLVGAEERIFKPGWRRIEPFAALFVGKLIPLHGVETILAAARLAPEIPFRIVGSGQLDDLLDNRPENVEWIDWVEYERLPEELERAGCALGIFGTSAKASRVIPNKVYQALACGTPVVTADTAAARELLVDGQSALLVPPGDPDALAAAVRRLAADPALAERLSGGGLYTFQQRASEDVLGRCWRGVLERAIERRAA
jgi:glycosyltransferase involved in cell wall biosynthesis